MTDAARVGKILRLYVIPDKSGYPLSYEEQARMCLKGGASAIQLRMKDAPGREIYDTACRLREMCACYGATFIVNDRLDVALACGADGVHLGQSDLPVSEAVRLGPPGFIVGATARTPQQAQEAYAAGASYIGSGAIRATATKNDASVMGIDGFSRICVSVPIPCVAIGGIVLSDVVGIMATGAAGVCVSGALVASGYPEDACRAFLKALELI